VLFYDTVVIVGGPYTTRISPAAWLDPEVHRRIISEASAEDNREIVRYATVAWGIYRSPGGVNRNVTHNATDTLPNCEV
jgi:hypothetical protein